MTFRQSWPAIVGVLFLLGLALASACSTDALSSQPRGGSGKADDTDTITKLFIGDRDGEKITLRYRIEVDGSTGSERVFARVVEAGFETPVPLPFTGSPIHAAFILAAHQSPGVQRIVSVPCQPTPPGYTCSAEPDVSLYIADSLGQLATARAQLTVVFDGAPIHDSFDGKSHFVVTNWSEP
jgi:hypothetical protein